MIGKAEKAMESRSEYVWSVEFETPADQALVSNFEF